MVQNNACIGASSVVNASRSASLCRRLNSSCRCCCTNARPLQRLSKCCGRCAPVSVAPPSTASTARRPSSTPTLVRCNRAPLLNSTCADDLDLFVCVTGLLCNDDRGEQLRQTIRDAKSLDRVVIGTDAPYVASLHALARLNRAVICCRLPQWSDRFPKATRPTRCRTSPPTWPSCAPAT